jgi:hypothetical protein
MSRKNFCVGENSLRHSQKWLEIECLDETDTCPLCGEEYDSPYDPGCFCAALDFFAARAVRKFVLPFNPKKIGP